jgi:hypothetical protein
MSLLYMNVWMEVPTNYNCMQDETADFAIFVF